MKLDGKSVRLASPVRFEGGAAPVAVNGRAYRGALVVRSRAGSMAVVNHVTLERYLRGVVPYEMPYRWHPEALKAQAVIARSYALATLKPGKVFDMHDDVRSQVYGGVRAEKQSTNTAVAATSRRVVLWRGSVASTFYHSTSGGRTAAVQDVWPKANPVPYLRGVPDPYSRLSPHHRWEPVAFTRAEFAEKLSLPAAKKAVDLRVRRNASGRAAILVLETAKGRRTLDARDVRLNLDLRSTWFRIGVLALDRPVGPVVLGEPLVLTGLARGLDGVVVQRLEGRSWRQVAKVRPRSDGRFRAQMRANGPAAYRLAAEGRAAPPIRVAAAPVVLAKVGRGERGA